jgi:hypothetical protein
MTLAAAGERSPVAGGRARRTRIRDGVAACGIDLAYLTFDPHARRWVAVGIDSSGNANLRHASAWDDDRLVFEGEATILGERVELRQVLHERTDDEYVLRNEERLAGRGWVALDEYRYRRRRAR